ncbi:DeoR family transcriptional regulator [Lentzea sp. NPDC102401]|uniref:DeoR family transcriptional regulator n=1 Tax=Lentzea sp. NPDC102401 TaxID=3364128 RepID=UPI0037FB47F5
MYPGVHVGDCSSIAHGRGEEKHLPGRAPAERAFRQVHLLDIVARSSFAAVSDLSRELQVSEVTIRADLRDLEEAGHVHRVWGGARPAGAPRPRPSRVAESMSAMAAALLRPDDVVLLAAGELSARVAAAMVERPELTEVTVISGDLQACEQLAGHLGRFTVRVTGGTLRGAVLVPARVGGHRRDQVDLAFVPCHRIGEDGMVYLTDEQAPAAAAHSVVTAERTVLLFPSNMFATSGGTPWLPIGEVDAVITTPVQDHSVLQSLRAAGAQVLIAGS